MNQRTDELMKTYKPEMTIVVYRDGQSYYLEGHSVNENGELMEGKPLLQETIQGIVDVFFDERKNMSHVTGIIPENLMAFKLLPGGNYRLVWYRPAEVRVMHFSKELKINTGKTWVPAMLYVAEGGQLDVFALNTTNRPTEKNKLYKAPFFNVADDGSVCLGNAKVTKPSERTYSNLMKYWEDLFWLSEFTHLNGSDDKTATRLQPLWKKLLDSKAKLKWQDLNELKPYSHLTIKSITK